MVTFPVDDVVPAAERLPVRSVAELFPDALVVGGDPTASALFPDGVHPLLSAVARAFTDHRPLVLSPDAVWLTIAQGVAQHVRLHAEQLRPRLVGHAGRNRLSITVDGPMPTDVESWQYVVEQLGKLLADEISDAEFFECDFSTSTQTERIAGRVVMLDAYSPYFAYWVTYACGIPSITLTGTVADWHTIRARVDTLTAFGLDSWHRSLVPITDQFMRAAGGDTDTAFWRRIYNPAYTYGARLVTGWVARLYPYLVGAGAVTRPNPLLELPIDEPRDITYDRSVGYRGPGISSTAVPATLSRVILNVNNQAEGRNQALALHAGLVGIAQDPDGALRPIAGWYLTTAQIEIDDVIDRIVADHQVTQPLEPHRLDYATADVMALYHRIDSATLFNGTWRILPASDHCTVYRGPDNVMLFTVIDLADGRSIAAAIDFHTKTFHWIACRIEPVDPVDSTESRRRYRMVDEPRDVPVYGTSLAFLLDAALDADGDISHLEVGRLNELDEAKQLRAARLSAE
jgi:hypothetical protein